MIESFKTDTARVNGQDICFSAGGRGDAVLLLHGFPQTHAMWHSVGPTLAQSYRVIAADLRGYGQSSKPAGTDAYTFSHMAADQLALMQYLGHDKFHLVGHDRGGRVAHRLALDVPDAVRSLTVMDIVPTHFLLDQLSREVAAAYYHWFFLAQPYPFPETLIGHDPDAFFESCLLGWGAATLDDFDPTALEAYRRAWRDPQTIRGMCADYRAALTLDFDQDTLNLTKSVDAPALVLYGEHGIMAKLCDIPSSWQSRLTNMQAQSVPGGHFFVDQTPNETAAVLHGFLSSLKKDA